MRKCCFIKGTIIVKVILNYICFVDIVDVVDCIFVGVINIYIIVDVVKKYNF